MPNGARMPCTNPKVAVTEPEWSDFKVLVALSRAGSVAGAARLLAVDHSTVSRRLSALEESVGACLVVRGGRELAWTTEGRTLLTAAEAIETLVAEASRTVRSAKLEVEGSVRLSCPPGLNVPLSRLLPELRAKYPRLDIEIGAENRTVDLRKGEADVAVRMFRPSEPALICKAALELGWAVYAAQSYVAQHGLPASLDELSKHRLVIYVAAMHGVPGPAWLEAHRGSASIAMHVDNTEVAAHAIASGGGIGVIPCISAESRPELVRVFAGTVASHTGYLVYHETLRDTARVRVAVDALTELFEKHAAAFAGRAPQ